MRRADVPRAVSALCDAGMLARRAEAEQFRQEPDLLTPDLVEASAWRTVLSVRLWLDPLSAGLLGFHVPGCRNVALRRVERRVARVLASANIAPHVLARQVRGPGVLTGAGRAVRAAGRIAGWSFVASFVLGLATGPAPGWSSVAWWLLMFAVLLGTASAVAVGAWAWISDRSLGYLISYPDGTDTGMSGRKRRRIQAAAEPDMWCMLLGMRAEMVTRGPLAGQD